MSEKITSRKFGELFDASKREAEAPVRKLDMDMAASIQVVIEEVTLKLAATIREETGLVNLCLAGGVALNCVANGRLRRSNIFEDVWAQPVSGDAGGAIGAAYCVWHQLPGNKKSRMSGDLMKGCLLGPSWQADADLKRFARSFSCMVVIMFGMHPALDFWSKLSRLAVGCRVLTARLGRICTRYTLSFSS